MRKKYSFLNFRYNDFKNDALSRCNCTPQYSSELTIAARCDLNDPNGTYPDPVLGYRPHGATDAKVRIYFSFEQTRSLHSNAFLNFLFIVRMEIELAFHFLSVLIVILYS